MSLLKAICDINKILLNSPDPTFAVERSINILGKAFNVEIVQVNKNSLNEESGLIYMESIFEWKVNNEVSSVDKNILSNFSYEELYGIFTKTLAIGEPLYGNIGDYPNEASSTAKEYANIGLKSYFVIPIFFNSNHWGNISLLGLQKEFDWEAVKDELIVIGGMFSSFFKVIEIKEAFGSELSTSQSAKMATLGEMASGIAHEINNPLFVINGFASKIDLLIEREALDIDELKKISQMIQRHCKRVTSIISGLRLISRKSKLDELEVKNFLEVIDSTVNISRERIRLADIHLLSNLVEGMDISIECHPEQISQVIINLLNNAHDSLIENEGEKWIELDVKELDDRVVFSVADSGRRVSPDVERMMMQPFYTTKDPGKGTGLGLSISKEIVARHGGKFYLDEHCENMKFIIELPKICYE